MEIMTPYMTFSIVSVLAQDNSEILFKSFDKVVNVLELVENKINILRQFLTTIIIHLN